VEEQEHAALLEEYRQLCEYHRHEDRLKYTILGLTHAGALLVVGWGIVRPASTAYPGLALLVAAALLYYGSKLYGQAHSMSQLRLGRAREVEVLLKVMDNHKRFHREDPRKNPGKRGQYQSGLAPHVIKASQVAALLLALLGTWWLISALLFGMLHAVTVSPCITR